MFSVIVGKIVHVRMSLRRKQKDAAVATRYITGGAAAAEPQTQSSKSE
jgi:hypothetical protein